MQDVLNVLAAFVTVAEERSFTKAAKILNISTSGLSHAIRRLEEQIGVRLLTRTTRSVSPTDAGEQLLAQLRPALADIRGTLTTVAGLQTKPIGRVRLLCPRLAAKTVLAPKLGLFARTYPDVTLEVTTDDSRVDPVAEGFDAAIHFGEFIAQDMVAVRIDAAVIRRDLERDVRIGAREETEFRREDRLGRETRAQQAHAANRLRLQTRQGGERAADVRKSRAQLGEELFARHPSAIRCAWCASAGVRRSVLPAGVWRG